MIFFSFVARALGPFYKSSEQQKQEKKKKKKKWPWNGGKDEVPFGKLHGLQFNPQHAREEQDMEFSE